MIFYINTILDLIEKHNASLGEEYKQLDICDILSDIDNLENEEEIKRVINELEKRCNYIHHNSSDECVAR